MFFSQALNCSRADENSYIKICTFFCSFPIVMMGKLQHDNVIDILQNIRKILSKWNLTIDQRQLHMFLNVHFWGFRQDMLLTLGMFLALRRSSTSKSTSMGTPNSKRSLTILSMRSAGFIWSVGKARCFLPSGVGQLLKMTSSTTLMGELNFHVIDTCCDVLSMIFLQLWLDPNLTSLSCPSGRFTTRCWANTVTRLTSQNVKLRLEGKVVKTSDLTV